MIYGSVCSGIEAATMAWHRLGWTPAFFSEIEKFPSAVLAHHYGSNMPGEPLATNGVPNHGDFTKIGPDAGPVDLLVGGTPCQSFSVAGKRLGPDDPRGNLALEYLALARRLRARWIVWENVPGVLSSRSGDEPSEDGEEAEGLESADFATFLSFVQECGYGFAYRVLDAQYIRVDEHARATPQRRRRVFVVGYLGDWRRAAAVLLEPQGMRGDPAPRRSAKESVAGAVTASAGRRGGTDDPERGKLVAEAFGGGNCTGPIDVSTALTAHGQRQDFEVETFIAEVAATLPAGGNSTGGERQPGMGAETAGTMLVAHAVSPAITKNPYGDHESREGLLVAHSLRGEGFDASEDGTGRGTPIVPVVARTLTRGAESKGKGGYAGRRQEDDDNLVATPLTLAIRGRDGEPDIEWRQDGTSNAILTPNGGRAGVGVGAIAYGLRNDAARSGEARSDSVDANGVARKRDAGFNIYEEHAPTLDAGAAHTVATAWAVRRLTPRECERLQRFPDDFTNIPWNGKDTAADGPRYKALGNSMAVNVMAWIGGRIDIMEKLIKSGRIGGGQAQ